MRRLPVLVGIVGLCFLTPNAQHQDTDGPEEALRESTEASRSMLAYRSDRGWSGALDIPMGTARDHRLTLGFVFGNDPDLPPEHPGNRPGLESRTASTTRIGLRLEFAWGSVCATLAWARPAVSLEGAR